MRIGLPIMSKNIANGTKIDWCCIGSAKCGTTSFHSIFSQHPQVDASARKELHFWQLGRIGNLEDYHNNFKYLTDRRKISGESTPGYVFFTDPIKRLKGYNQDLKLIWIVREPYEAIISSYYYNRRIKMPFAQVMKLEPRYPKNRADTLIDPHDSGKQMIGRYCYGTQMERLLNYFPRNQIIIIKDKQFKNNLNKTMLMVTRTIGLDDHTFQLKTLNKNYNYKKPLPELMKENFTPEVKERCENLFLPELEKFEKLSGVNCSEWKKRLTSFG